MAIPIRSLLTWHKRFGILSAFFVIILSVTGILLNHAAFIKLDNSYISSPPILKLYGIRIPTVTAAPINEQWIYHIGGNIYNNNTPLESCDGHLIGAVANPTFTIIACDNSVLFYSATMEFIDSLNAHFGLPTPVQQIGAIQEHIVIRSQNQLFFFDDALTIQPAPTDTQATAIQWSNIQKPPKEMLSQIQHMYVGTDITWERLILDIHAGRFLGKLGPLIMDLIAMMFIVLAVTGIIIWNKKNKKKEKKKKTKQNSNTHKKHHDKTHS